MLRNRIFMKYMKIVNLIFLSHFFVSNSVNSLGQLKVKHETEEQRIDGALALTMFLTNRGRQAENIVRKLLFNRALSKEENDLLNVYRIRKSSLKKREIEAFRRLNHATRVALFRDFKFRSRL